MKPDIYLLFGMTPENAIAYLKQKNVVVSWDWQDMLDDAHVSAFTIAKSAGMDVSKPPKTVKHSKILNANCVQFWKTKAGGAKKMYPIPTQAKCKPPHWERHIV